MTENDLLAYAATLFAAISALRISLGYRTSKRNADARERKAAGK